MHPFSRGVVASEHFGKPAHLLTRALTLRTPEGAIREFEEATVSIGSASTADFQIEGPNVGAEHAQLAQRSGRTFCTALVGDEEDLTSSTYTWLNGDQIRKGVAYVVAPQTELAFGEPGSVYVVDFAQKGGGSAMFETLLKGRPGTRGVV
ncbi:hypothetical protein WJX75_005002 [Coccomyxa subellipsoidea]|uniref:FHA domain-containing protein n=1 Tax=Coccomyxa subellipsoidea TaxID=248742 RepID=A0ABR2YBI2_9CHLO